MTDKQKKQPIENAKKAFSFMTAESKKVIIALIFLASVVLDTIYWDNTLYAKDALFASNVFRGVIITIAIIITKDAQSIFSSWIEKQFGTKDED